MKINNQLFIDEYIAKPIAFILNFFVRLIGKILRIDHRLDKKFKTIVICKFKGLGSIIQATPMIEAIKEIQPSAKIIFVSTKSNEEILKKIHYIDKIILVNDKNVFNLVCSIFSSIFKLIRLRPDVYIDLEIYSNFSTLITLFSFAKNRIGFYLRSSSFRMGIYTHMMFFNTKVSISDVYLQISSLFGETKHKPELYPIYENCSLSEKFTIHKPYILINPNASDLRIERRWNKENYTELIQLILKFYPDYQIVLIGSKSESEYVSTIISDLKNSSILNFAGKTNMEDLIILIKHAKLVITNDTGPMHIAFTCKTPSVCLFGPCSPEQYAIYENSYIIYKKIYCSPCVHDFSTPPCLGDNVCMKLIQVQEVFSVIRAFFDNNMKFNYLKEEKQSYIFQYDDKTLGSFNR